MGLFATRPRVAPPKPTARELAMRRMYDVVGALEWTIHDSHEDGGTILVPKEDKVKMRCHLSIDSDCLVSEIDAGLRIATCNFSPGLSWAVLMANGVSRYGTFRVRRHDARTTSVCFGGFLDPALQQVDQLVHAIRMQSIVMHAFALDQVKRGNLAYPIDFMGFATETIPIRFES